MTLLFRRTVPLRAPSDVFRAQAAAQASAEAGNPLLLRRVVQIRNSRGLHARAAAKLVSCAERFSACVTVSRDGQKVPACSIMGLMMLGAGKGSEVVVEAEGWDAREALDAVAGLIEAGFHED
ncbi:HPr family phosphocarrier protein [Roseomonas sp. E05]|uniref:HPr family phosphocarrier protein n=1 Tax=Roseomonas sp. E05 TaxID=3046310 RepID=UPI0024BBC97A|nr:HPr family phosphocarrier protein [Roseomonas sp. E05]MDJ0388067.1 HPr family phosphocarrier protein [Roseomonas sp. E05]